MYLQVWVSTSRLDYGRNNEDMKNGVHTCVCMLLLDIEQPSEIVKGERSSLLLCLLLQSRQRLAMPCGHI